MRKGEGDGEEKGVRGGEGKRDDKGRGRGGRNMIRREGEGEER